MEKLAQFIKILGDVNRLTILHSIGDKACSVSEIIGKTNLSQTLVSFHLRNLRDVGIVSTRRDGPFIYYSLANLSLIDILNDLAIFAGLKNIFFSGIQDVESDKTISVNIKQR